MTGLVSCRVLDFQCCRVYDEVKLVVQLKNKRKYDIGFQ